MKFLFPVLLLTALCSVTGMAAGGSSGSHGGGMIYCPGDTPNVDVINLLDLYEAKAVGLTIHSMTPPGVDFTSWLQQVPPGVDPWNWAIKTQTNYALDRLSKLNAGLADAVRKMIPHVKKVRRPVPKGKSLPPPMDVALEYLPFACKLAGVGRYHDDGDYLEVDDYFYSDLSIYGDLPAFWVHEALYKVLREFEAATDSTTTRLVIGYLFSDSTTPSKAVKEITSSALLRF